MKTRAGILVYKKENNEIKVLLAHMGGPFYTNKDAGAWDIPKGEFEGENGLSAAHREFEEEIGQPAPIGEALDLGTVKNSGKVVMIWAVGGDLDVSKITSNKFQMEWPPKSGKLQEFPEVDKADWFSLPEASIKIVKSRHIFLDRLADRLNVKIEAKPEQPSLF
jgi:predicted NUDIX family NTP pyrophosphohydrolase